MKVIAVSVPALGLLGGLVAYQAQASPTGRPAAYHLRAPASPADLADGIGEATAAVSTPASHATATPATPATSPAPAPPASQGAARSPAPPKDSPASLRAAVQKDIDSGNYLLAVAQYLVENGYSDAAAAGVASCVYGESGGNPESVGSGGGGLIGWTPLSSAAPNPDIITGNRAQDMLTQLSDLLYYDSTEIGQSQVNQLNASTDPVAAADFFSQNFEKPAITDSDVRPSMAEQIYSELRG